nr:zinc finger, CCHC-type [Tanacetum cinerariifolium]
MFIVAASKGYLGMGRLNSNYLIHSYRVVCFETFRISYKLTSITLKCKGKLDHIDSPLLDPLAVNVTPEQVAAYQALFVKYDMVVLRMSACIAPKLQKDMENHNAFDMINELKNMFQTQGSQKLYDTQRKLNACKMEEGQSVSLHFLKMKSYIDTLECLRDLVPHLLAFNTML